MTATSSASSRPYADVVFQSRFAVHLLGEASRTIKGKRDLTHYFERRAGGGSSIEFEFLGVFHGVDTLVLHFQSKTYKCAEFMELNPEGKVRRSMPTFGPEKRMCGATRVAPRWRVPEYF